MANIQHFYYFLDTVLVEEVTDGIFIPELTQLYNNFSYIIPNHQSIAQNQMSGLIETWCIGNGYESSFVMRNRVRLLEGFTFADHRIPTLIACWTRGKTGDPENLRQQISLYKEIFGKDFFQDAYSVFQPRSNGNAGGTTGTGGTGGTGGPEPKQNPVRQRMQRNP